MKPTNEKNLEFCLQRGDDFNAIYSANKLTEITEGDSALAIDLLSIYLETTDGVLAEIIDQLKERNVIKAKHLMHRLLGSVLIVHVPQLIEQMRNFENYNFQESRQLLELAEEIKLIHDYTKPSIELYLNELLKISEQKQMYSGHKNAVKDLLKCGS